jgi:hypothetical protein
LIQKLEKYQQEGREGGVRWVELGWVAMQGKLLKHITTAARHRGSTQLESSQ